MTSPDDIGAAARDAAQAYGLDQYAAGSIAGAASRQAEVDGLEAQERADLVTIATLRATNAALITQVREDVEVLNAHIAQINALQAAYDEYKATHPDPVPPLVMGMNFSSTATIASGNKPFESLADAARIFVGAGRTDIRQEGEYVRAYAAGVRVFCFSWKDTTTPAWFGTVPDDVTWYGVHWHEPEDDIADGKLRLSDWKARQVTQMAKVREAGGIPWVILMGYTMAPASKRNAADYTLPAGTVDGYGIDFYPDKSPNRTQAQILDAFKAMLPTWGVQRWSVCEYGVIGTSSDAVADILEVKPLLADAEFACYWSSQATGKPNYRFTEQTATAWYA